MKNGLTKRGRISSGAVVAFLAVLSIFAIGTAHSDTAEFELERSGNLRDWESVLITPDLLTEDGAVRMPAQKAGIFFRLRIKSIEDESPSDPFPSVMVQVEGGALPAASEIGPMNVATFLVGKHEVTWGEWKYVRSWAVENGYDIGGIGAGCDDDHPVHSVSWYDVLKWSNAKSQMENLTPVYTVGGATYKSGQHVPSRETTANGYRLPSEAEWEFAARGGNQSQGYTYSGSNVASDVAWHLGNSGGAACNIGGGSGTWPVGQKAANELGLHDMSGNVYEWCWNSWDSSDSARHFRGGSWAESEFTGSVSFRNGSIPSMRNSNFGFRLARGAGNGGGSGDVDGGRIIGMSGELDFGAVHVGESASRTLTISNTGTSPLSIIEIVYPPGFSGSWSGTIPADASQDVAVVFSPSEERTYTGEVTVASDATQGTNLFLVSGTGLPAESSPAPEGMVRVEGGAMPGISAFFGAHVDTFYIARHEVTWGEWREVRNWATGAGYDIGSVGDGCADSHPVHSVSWYDVVKWCNARSEKEGLAPAYWVNGEVYKTGASRPTMFLSANGYRLPMEAEWEYAARGGTQSRGYSYSGSNDVHEVAWYDATSGGAACQLFLDRGTWPVGQKKANELGLYDMSGNVWEWCWDAYTASHRRVRGGSWYFLGAFCNVAHRNYAVSADRVNTIGFRVARSE